MEVKMNYLKERKSSQRKQQQSAEKQISQITNFENQQLQEDIQDLKVSSFPHISHFPKNELVHLKNKEKLEKMKIHKEYNIEIEEL